MKHQKKILVMMSTYNGENHLSAQIDSILDQKTTHEICIRIRDDGSNDRTCEIIEEYINKYPFQLELLKGENIGYNASFFELIREANGFDYYAISDQDDVWINDKLQVACEAIDAGGAVPVLYASPSFLIHDDLVPYGITRKKEREMTMFNTIIQNICPGHNQVMNNQLISMLKDEIDVSQIYVYDSWITNVANLYGNILFDNNPHTYYRQYDGNQFGADGKMIGRFLLSNRRMNYGDGKKYRGQIKYYYEKYGKESNRNKAFFDEIKNFLSAQTLAERMWYVSKSKLYRQSRIETFAWEMAVVSGRF